LEKVHQNLPTIEEFVPTCVITAADELSTDIEPVTALSFFRISISYVENDHVETHIQFYQYMTQKYKNVTTICHKHDAEMLEYHPDEARRVYLNGILGFYRIMKPYDRELEIYFVPDDVDIFEVLYEMDWQLEVLCISLCQGGTLFRHLLLLPIKIKSKSL
jgi:hypothetical protein